MKQHVIALTTFATLQTLSFAGSHYKTMAPVAPQNIFRAEELQLDAFGVYGVGEVNRSGPFSDHAWGGGIGANYFWTNNLGFGIDADLKHGRENRGGEHQNFAQFTGSLIYRIPIEQYAVAPYFFAGGGGTTNSESWASAHAGLGIEYRLVPNQIGLFTDARWTYYGDRNGSADQNNFQIRSGVRFLF